MGDGKFSEIVEFWLSQCIKTPSGCLLWPTKPRKYGYAETYIAGKRRKAHRFIFMAVHGPIPKGLLVCHTCDVRNCVNPDHLFLGTHADNMQDMKRKGRASRECVPNRGAGNPGAKLTDADVRKIRQRAEDGDDEASIAADYNVVPVHIRRIVQRKKWKHI